MCRSTSQGFIVTALCAAAFMVAAVGYAQTTSVPTGSKVTSSSPPSPPKSTAPEDLQWNELGATAQCRDGTYFHGKPAQGACFDHGGVRKWLNVRLE
jgi:hypothetical protein